MATTSALNLEARVGIEPTHKGFADLSLTTWVPRLGKRLEIRLPILVDFLAARVGFDLSEDLRRMAAWSGRRGSNPRLRPWQGRALPLSYSRPTCVGVYRDGARTVNEPMLLTVYIQAVQSAFLALFMAKGHHRIDVHRRTCGNQCCRESYKHQKQRNAGKTYGIVSANVE